MLKFSHIIPNSKGVFMTKCTIQRKKVKAKVESEEGGPHKWMGQGPV